MLEILLSQGSLGNREEQPENSQRSVQIGCSEYARRLIIQICEYAPLLEFQKLLVEAIRINRDLFIELLLNIKRTH